MAQRERQEKELLEQSIDVHAHILPETDDGARSWEEAVEMLKIASRQGFQRIIATPHFAFSQKPDLLRKKAERLNQEAYESHLDIRVSVGQEILYFEEILSYLAEGKALTMAGSRYVLLEFAPEDPYSKIDRGIRELVQGGYFPILAHGERYICLREKGRLEDLIRSGAYIQMNYRSLDGNWMDGRSRWCRKQALAGNVHFLGTDMHNTESRSPRREKAAEWLEKHGESRWVERLTRTNPQHILDDRFIKS